MVACNCLTLQFETRISALEDNLRAALVENEKLKKENIAFAENFKRVATSTGDTIEMQQNLTKANGIIEELKQKITYLESLVSYVLRFFLL